MRTIPALTLDGLAAVPWALDRQVLDQLVAYAQRGEAIAAVPRPTVPASQRGAVAVIPIHGVIEHRASFLLEVFGGTSVESIRAMLRAAVADPQISSIVLDVDSPGGGVEGVTELAAEIRGARAAKRVVAVANTMACSAGVWLASQADQVLVSPSGQVGSIGVYAVHFDLSDAYAAEGVKPTVISAGEHKTDGNEFEPLSDDAKAQMQRRVNAYYAQFVNDVALGRRVTRATVEADYGQGIVFLAKDALAAGLVDGIGTLDDALRLAARPPAAARAEGDGPDPAEVDLPFRARVEMAASELASLTEHAEVRARLREKEGRPRFSEPTEASLRSIRDAISALLADEPPEAIAPAPAPVEPVVTAAPVQPAVPAPTRFRSADDWAAYIAREFTTDVHAN